MNAIREVLADFEVFNTSAARQVALAESLEASGIDLAELRQWLESLVLEFPDRPMSVARVAATTLADPDDARRAVEGHQRGRAVRAGILAKHGEGSRAHALNRDSADVEERRRERFCAEFLVLRGGTVDAAVRQYGYSPETIERIVREWAPQFAIDPCTILAPAESPTICEASHG